MALFASEGALTLWLSIALLGCAGAKPIERPSERPLSAYESHWLKACGEDGRTGECPQEPDVHFVVNDGRPELVVPDSASTGTTTSGSICPWVERNERVRVELGPSEGELRECFSGATGGTSWIKYAWPPPSPVKHQVLGNVSERTAACVSRILGRALGGLELGDARALLVLFGHQVPGHDGHLDLDDAFQASVEHDPAPFGRCYQLAMKLWPTLEGTHIAELVVAADGSVPVVRTAGGTAGNPALACCVNTAIRHWKYPTLPARSAIRVLKNFRFRQEPPAKR